MNTVKTNVSVPLFRTTTSATPSSIRFDVAFRGTLPAEMVSSKLALEAFISIPSHLACWITPIVQVLPMYFEPEDEESDVIKQVPTITFLPLPSSFDHLQRSHWVTLTQEIQRWIISADASSPEAAWAADLFWMAYYSSYPTFPAGQWESWDPRIKLFGTAFDRMAVLASTVGGTHRRPCTNECPACMHVREAVWEEFVGYAALM